MKQLKRHIPDKPGIYYLYEGNEIVYVGQTLKSIKSRVKHHKSTGKQFTHITWELLEDVLIRYERFLIQQHRPKYNVQFNPSYKSSRYNMERMKEREAWSNSLKESIEKSIRQ